jgi:hypothetical protein
LNKRYEIPCWVPLAAPGNPGEYESILVGMNFKKINKIKNKISSYKREAVSLYRHSAWD